MRGRGGAGRRGRATGAAPRRDAAGARRGDTVAGAGGARVGRQKGTVAMERVWLVRGSGEARGHGASTRPGDEMEGLDSNRIAQPFSPAAAAGSDPNSAPLAR